MTTNATIINNDTSHDYVAVILCQKSTCENTTDGETVLGYLAAGAEITTVLYEGQTVRLEEREELPEGVGAYSRQVIGLDFGDVIKGLKQGKRYSRSGWNGKGIYIEMQTPNEISKMTLPYIYIVTNQLVSDNPDAPRGTVPWLASETDMLCNDWSELLPE